jgi:hypothetical protein
MYRGGFGDEQIAVIAGSCSLRTALQARIDIEGIHCFRQVFPPRRARLQLLHEEVSDDVFPHSQTQSNGLDVLVL